METTLPKESPKETDENPIPCSPGFLVGKNGTTIELLGQDLWKKFHKLGTEMIITKAGRYVQGAQGKSYTSLKHHVSLRY